MKRLDRLKTRFATALAAARENPKHGLPAWAQALSLNNLSACPLVICGTGHWAAAMLGALSGRAEIVAVVDDSQAGKMVLGFPCLDTTGFIELVQKRPEIVCVNTGQSHAGFGHFACLAEELGLKILNYLQAIRAFGLRTDIRIADWLHAIVARAEEFTATEALLSDEESAETLYAFLIYHLETDREALVIGNRPGDATYFRTGLFELSDEEIYIDCGSYDGDSVRHFVHATRSRFQRVHAFEPDPTNFQRLEKWLRDQSHFRFSQRITIHQKAVGDQNGMLTFNDTGSEGACVPQLGVPDQPLVGVPQGIQVPVVRLDDAFDERCTLLKLDVEGHELAILRGATGHLRRDRPRIAACAYHLPGDLIELPRYLKELDLGYRLAVRHHSNTRYDTVLYAF